MKKKFNLLIKRVFSILFSIMPCIIVLFTSSFSLNVGIIVLLYFAWTLTELYMQNWDSNSVASQKPYDRKTRYYIVGCRHASLWMSAIFIVTVKNNYNFEMITLGVLSITLGVLLRILAINKLKEYFTMEIDADEKQEIINNGIYKYIRHPSYLGILLIFIGFPLVAGSLLIVLIVLIATTTRLIYRMNIEEKLLLEKTQSRYAEYIKKTNKLLPFIY